MAASEAEIAAKLIERLLADPAFRDRFRRDPPRACREAGLESLAEEMRLGAGKAMHTLDIRESRSSLAGVMMAAAMEGMGVYEFSKHVVPHIDDLGGQLGEVCEEGCGLERVCADGEGDCPSNGDRTGRSQPV